MKLSMRKKHLAMLTFQMVAMAIIWRMCGDNFYYADYSNSRDQDHVNVILYT